MNKLACLVIVYFLFLFQNLNGQGVYTGSIVLVYVANNTITLASDSRVINHVTGIVKDSMICKALSGENTIGGYVGVSFGTAGLRTQDILQFYLNESKPIYKYLETLESDFKTLVKTFVLDDAAHHLESLKSKEFVVRHHVETVLCSYIGNEARIFYRSFIPSEINGDVVVNVTRNDTLFMPGSYMLLGGTKDSVEKDFASIEGFGYSVEEGIRIIITRESMRNHSVGGPIDIVQLVRGQKPRWIQQKPNCRKND